jgi:O-antigen ligase
MIAAVGAGIGLVVVVGLLSRLHPAWFPEADQTARFLTGGRERLSYPLNYWNALAALIAIGLPLMLEVATCAKAILFRALAAAALPTMALTAFLTLSRGGIGAAIVALVVFLAFTSDRLPKVLTLLVAGGGSAILISAAGQRDALQDGLLNATARQQGDEMVLIVLGVCIAVGLIQAALSWGLKRGMRPRWTFPSRRQALVATGIGLLVVLVALVAIDAPGRTSDAWTEFKEGGGPGEGSERLTSFAGESRYLLWRAAVDENASKPLLGTGSGTFEFWWTRNGEGAEVVRDTHSLYLQVLGELGVVGLVLLAAFLSTILVGGGYAVVRAGPRGRPQLAAALAGCVAFCLTATVDWMWQIPVLPVTLLLLASSLVTVDATPAQSGGRVLRLPLRLAFAIAAIAAIVAMAVPLASMGLLRQSAADAREGNFPAALRAARSAQDVQPGAAAPRLQQALLFEEQGDLESAAGAARAATEREPTNWRNWLVLSRIEAQQGEAVAAVRDYRKAKSLNPHFSLFE